MASKLKAAAQKGPSEFSFRKNSVVVAGSPTPFEMVRLHQGDEVQVLAEV